MWSRGSDRFTGVSFPGIGTFDILWASLEIIDQKYLEEVRLRRAERLTALKSAEGVVCARGPRGGFRWLTYQYLTDDGIRTHASTSSKEEAEELMEFFRGHGIQITEQVVT